MQTAPSSPCPAAPDPARLDVRALASEGQALQGCDDEASAVAARYARLGAARSVRWQAQWHMRAAPDGVACAALHLRVHALLVLACARCTQALEQVLEVDRNFLFVSDEDSAARLDACMEDDVLVAQRAFDLYALIEDELLMAVPLAASHAQCSAPAPLRQDQAPHPFAALAHLKL